MEIDNLFYISSFVMALFVFNSRLGENLNRFLLIILPTLYLWVHDHYHIVKYQEIIFIIVMIPLYVSIMYKVRKQGEM